MAGVKNWFEKIKNRILKKDFDEDLLESKIQSENKRDVTDENGGRRRFSNLIDEKNELPDLITPTNNEINKTSCEGKKENEIQREEAIRVIVRHKRNAYKSVLEKSETKTKIEEKMLEIEENQVVNIKNQHFKPVPECRRGTRIVIRRCAKVDEYVRKRK